MTKLTDEFTRVFREEHREIRDALLDLAEPPTAIFAGTDEIAVGLIYRRQTVTPTGAARLLTAAVDTRFNDNKNRPALAQTFTQLTSGGRLTVVVNHLKSKGSACTDVALGSGCITGSRASRPRTA